MDRITLGVDTFGDVMVDEKGRPLGEAASLRHVLEEGIIADQTGLDVFAVGEHHRDDYAISAPETLLAGLATRTQDIHLSSAVTVLSSDDPVRVYQRFATVDALSEGRAEVILGRGSFTESFPLFGYSLEDYEVLFEEKLGMWIELMKEQPVTWSGSTRPGLQDAQVYPRTDHEGGIPTWIGVGGSPQSVVRAAAHGLPLMLAIIGGEPQRFAPYVDLFHRAADQLGVARQQVGMHSHGHIAATDEQALEEYWPAYRAHNARLGAERGWPAMTKEHFLQEVEHGALYVGSPRTVAEKMVRNIRALDVQRFDFIYTAGQNLPSLRRQSVELYGSQVVPMVREMLADSERSGEDAAS
ncbi:LLM class flavin-dependent oxidoreductase [Brachybacterium halotolerans subsp. kimchii]|uniref:LLM class flavin-dependent oxidoreductase n=1 Tax=Brachybacterium halotolerans TaxID=2795215 RepID=UPI001E5FCEEF|nr:LLM class flavin-dependent oxidoreductase [Brachybacterium halotolerans]UEJ83945.1 LLM class flavin-dependent oxidoreductase [Brachybacterium halotolerans subsp. kimchii]